MRLSIRTKFLIIISLLLLLIFGTITISQIKSRTNSLRRDLFQESKAFASLATQPIGNVFAIYKDSGTIKIDQETEEFLELNDNITNVAVVDINGQVLFAHDTNAEVNVTAEEAGTFEAIYKNNDNGVLETVIYPYFEASGAHRFSIIYSVSSDEIDKAVSDEALSLLYFGIASLLITMSLVYLLINRFILYPVRQVSQQAAVISAGNLEQQILVHGHDEIAALGESVNKMAESLKASIAQLQEVDRVKSEFMMITSHNLRTPLTIISGYLEDFDSATKDPDKLRTTMQRIGTGVKRLEVFAEDVLTISRFELGEAKPETKPIKVSELLNLISTEFRPAAEQQKLMFTLNVANPDDFIDVSKPYIRSAVWNILDNASKFTKEGGSIDVNASREGQFVKIDIVDTGIGITPEEIPKIFTKFHRGTSTLVYDFEGTGIGLYASKMMVERHGGTISVHSQVGKGSTFTIRLPVTNKTS